ncbi:efflux RND transporter periplasmic adaptor subunit [Kaarinaea lacus]
MAGSGAKGAGKPQMSDMTGQGKARAARLCYVDDSRTSAYVVKRILKPYGYEVDHFESAEPALIAIIESDYDLLLTDLKVSPTGMDGDDLVRALRASGHKQVANLPVIVITGATDTQILSQVYEAGANQIVTKPVNGEELDAHIRKLVFESKNAGEDEFAELAAEADAQAGITSETGAKVVLFGSEAKKDATADASQGPESKPGADDLAAKTKESTPPLMTTDGRPVPRPAGRVKPAPRVKPIVRPSIVDNKQETGAKPTPTGTGSGKAKISPAQVEAARKAKELAAMKMRAAAKLAQKNPAEQPARKAVDQEALAKVKAAAAAKRAKLIEQQKAKMAAQAKLKQQQDRAQREKIERARAAKIEQARRAKVQATLEPEIPLTLEPKDSEPVDVFNRSKPEISSPFENQNFSKRPVSSSAGVQQPGAGRPQPSPRSRPQGGPAQQQHGAQASAQAPDNNTDSLLNDPFAAAAKTAQQNFGSTEASHTADLFGQSNNSNILQQMDQYPLVQSDYRDSVGSSGVMSMFSSVIELWGPKKVIMAVILVAGLAFFYNNWSGLFSSGMAVETTLVEQGEIFQSITVPGKVVSKLRVDVTPSIAGRLTNVYVEEGDSVKKGELMARLDDREARSNLKRAEAALNNAEEDVALAERSLKRLRQAFSKGAVAGQLVEEAEVELRSAKARLSVAEEEVRTSKLSLENPRIVAPFAGTITARYVEVGQWVVPSETLFTLVDQSQREIEVRVDAADSGGIAVGQTVTLSSDAFPGLEWSESVTRLAAATSNVGNANTVSVYISLGSKAPSLRFGQQVDAEIRTSWNPSALKVPYGAIITRGGKSYVAVVDNNVITLVEVETGIEDFTHVEIRQGVHVGQYIILANGADIEEGDRVILSNN